MKLDRILEGFSRLGICLGGFGVVVMIILIFFNVIARYVFNKPVMFVEEYSGYLLGLVVYVSLAYTARTGGHVSVSLVTKRLSKYPKGILELFTLVVTLALMILYFVFTLDYTYESFRTNARAVTLMDTRLWIPQEILCVGLVFLILEIVALIVKAIISLFGKSGEEDSLQV